MESNETNSVERNETVLSTKPPFLPWNNPENIISAETSEKIEFSLECVAIPIIVLSGTTGNVMSLIVLVRSSIKTTTILCLVALALVDSLFLVTTFLQKSTCILIQFDCRMGEDFGNVSFNTLYYLKFAFGRLSSCFTVIITLERLLAVTFPLKVKTWVTKRRMISALVGITVAMFVFLAPMAANFQVKYVQDLTTGTERRVLVFSDFYIENRHFLDNVYYGWILPVLFRYLPMVIVPASNIAIYVTLKRTQLWRKKLSSVSRVLRQDETRMRVSEIKIAYLVIIISTVFFVSLLPGTIHIIAMHIVPNYKYYGKYHNLYQTLSDVVTFFELLNSAVNFIIYVLLSKQFSDTFKDLFCRCRKVKKKTESACP